MFFRKVTVLMLSLFLILVLLSATRCRTQTSEDKEGKKEGEIGLMIVSPKEGESLQEPDVNAKVRVTGVNLVEADGVNDPKEGHLHYTFDGELKMTAETTVSYVGIAPGEHTLTVELVQNDHSPRRPVVKRTIKFSLAGAPTQNEGGSGQQENPPSNY